MSSSVNLPLSIEPVDKPLDKGNNLIYSYFIESTGIIPVFENLISSFLISDTILKLNKKDDESLIELLKDTANEVFPRPISRITPPLPDLLHNAYYRLFGYTIKGSEVFPKPDNFNSEFNTTFNQFGFNVFQMILDKGITTERLGSPHATAEIANNIRKQMEARTFNTIEHLADDTALKLYRLIELLQNKKLMIERLGVRSESLSGTFREVAERVKTPAAKESSDLFLLAGRMNILLLEIQRRDWDSNSAESLVTDENIRFFKALESSWFHITGKSWMTEGLKTRRRV